ncbi:MAG: acyltransferase family protein [Bacteroidaceae bacterium]|nr:acyltransferase family protein [Bacteroidaceae bacterium]
MDTRSLQRPLESPEVNTPSFRLPYFDLAKGVCILLVILYHLQEAYEVYLPSDHFLLLVRMPLYYFLSGFFFKKYDGFTSFAKKKVKRLLIPFLFFYLFTSVLLPILANRFLGISFSTGNDWSLLYAFLTYAEYPNIPLWFLWALFLLNLLFYQLHSHCRSIPLLGFICLLLSCILGNYSPLHLPASLNRMFDGLLFFYFGYVFRFFFTDRLQQWYYATTFTVLFFLIGWWTPENTILLLIQHYIGGFLGIAALVLFCRRIGHLPYVSYLGRYSIMVLVTHEPLIRLLQFAHVPHLLIAFGILLVLYPFIIPLMRRYLPYVTAQKS